MEFKDRLAMAMAAADVAAGGLAKAVDVSPSAVSHWMSGNKTPRRDKAQEIADVLGVDASWLEFGTGVGPMPDLDAARARYLDDTAWVFRDMPADGAIDRGSATAFVFEPTVATFVREIGQNFLDVVRGRHATLRIRVIRLRGGDLEAFLDALRWDEELLPHLEASAREGQKFGRSLEVGLERIRERGELILLRLEEHGTTGLTGDEFGTDSNFTALVRNTLDSVKASGAGGAFGLGKAVLWLTSSVSTILFNSDLAVPLDGKQHGRICGRAELSYHRLDGHGGEFPGPGWFGENVKDDKGERAESHWDNPALARDLCLERPPATTGTSILVVGFHDPSSEEDPDPAKLADGLEEALSEYFFPALGKGDIEVHVEVAEGPTDSDVVRATRVEPGRVEPEFVELLAKHQADDITESLQEEGDVVRMTVPLRIPARRDGTHGELHHEAVLLVRRASDDDPATKTHRTVFYRGTGMIIETRDMSHVRVGARPFHAAVLCGRAAGSDPTDHAAEEFLRIAEPPAHHRWELTPDLGALYLRGGKAALEEFRRNVVEAIKQLVGPASRDLSDGPRELKEMLRITGKGEDRNRPRVTRASGRVDDEGRWEVTATLTVKPEDSTSWKGRPVVVFNGETGAGVRVEWDEIVPERNCRLEEPDRLVLDAGKRQAVFRGVTRSSSHPVPAHEAAVSVDFRAVEKIRKEH